MEFSIQITGTEKLRADLEALPKNVRRRVMVKALRSAARKVLEFARTTVPVRTGRLRRALRVKAARRSRGSVAYFVYLPERERLGIPAGSKWYYPGILVAGHGSVRARPFIDQAFDKVKASGIEERILDELRRFIDMEWSR